MLRIGSRVRVHVFSSGAEIRTRNYNKTFRVCGSPLNMGIEWNVEKNPYVCRGELFNPFSTFASYTGTDGVIFENVETGEKYHFSNMKNGLEKLGD